MPLKPIDLSAFFQGNVEAIDAFLAMKQKAWECERAEAACAEMKRRIKSIPIYKTNSTTIIIGRNEFDALGKCLSTTSGQSIMDESMALRKWREEDSRRLKWCVENPNLMVLQTHDIDEDVGLIRTAIDSAMKETKI